MQITKNSLDTAAGPEGRFTGSVFPVAGSRSARAAPPLFARPLGSLWVGSQPLRSWLGR
jgi:hypothetical protein